MTYFSYIYMHMFVFIDINNIIQLYLEYYCAHCPFLNIKPKMSFNVTNDEDCMIFK